MKPCAAASHALFVMIEHDLAVAVVAVVVDDVLIVEFAYQYILSCEPACHGGVVAKHHHPKMGTADIGVIGHALCVGQVLALPELAD